MLFTENLSRAHRVASRLRAGTVWVNCFFIRDLRTPFGGVGDSGVGREGGNFSREFFTEPKAVVMSIRLSGNFAPPAFPLTAAAPPSPTREPRLHGVERPAALADEQAVTVSGWMSSHSSSRARSTATRPGS